MLTIPEVAAWLRLSRAKVYDLIALEDLPVVRFGRAGRISVRALEPCTVAKKLKKLLVDAGLPHMRFHDLRHSAATILLEARVDLKTVQERLGHSSMAITADIYSHVTSKMHEEVIGKIDDMFKHS